MTMVPIGFSEKLPARRVMRAWVDGQELVVWRSASGKLSAWDNRCPHRGMRLSYGFVRGETLACIYHGWHYGIGGGCKYIPAHPELEPPSSISSVSYFIMEAQGVLWASISGPQAPPKLMEGLEPIRSITVECSYGSIVKQLHRTRIFDQGGITLTASEQPMILTYAAAPSNFKVLILIQLVSDNSVNLHLMCSNNWSVKGRIAVSRWCEEIQRLCELSNQKAAG